MRVGNLLTGVVLGVALAFAALLSLRTLGPRWGSDPALGPLAAAAGIMAGYWLIVAGLRRHSALLDGTARWAMLGAVCLTWLFIYGAVKAHDDPPIFGFLGALLWLPSVVVFRVERKTDRARRWWPILF